MFRSIIVLILPLMGTSLGAAAVLFPGYTARREHTAILSGFSAGVMTAASIWSLILPAIDSSSHLGVWAFIPALVGLWTGFFFLQVLRFMTHFLLCPKVDSSSTLLKTTLLVLAVALHNFPEGMAVGVATAMYLAEGDILHYVSALSLSIGIAIQNIPEGAIISLPLHSEGMGKRLSLVTGILSGVIEPIAALITVAVSGLLIPLLPYFLCFAAGAMLYVVVAELLSQWEDNTKTNLITASFFIGFSIMMVLDITLG